MKLFTTLAACLAVFLSLTSVSAQSPTSIESLMTDEELRATGVGSLSAQEKAALNEWLLRYSEGEISISEQVTPPTAAQVERPVETASQAAPVAAEEEPMPNWRRRDEKVDFVSTIPGEFSGWSGKTRFTLENGQVWEQRRRSRWKVNMSNPEVRIYQNFMGAYEMEVLEADRSIGVKRIR